MAKRLSIIIPSYQGGKWISTTINLLLESFPEAEIIVVNDGSTDDTKIIQNKFLGRIKYLENEKNQGKGYSLKKGVREAQGDYLIFTDSDLPFGIESIKKIQELLVQGCPLVIGTRSHFYNDKPYKKLLRPILYYILKWFFHSPYRDTQCGVKGFSREVAQEIFSLSCINRFALDVEILYLAKLKSIPVTSVDVEQNSRTPSTFHLKNITRMLWDLFRIKFHRYH